MKYFMLVMFLVAVITCVVIGCSPYQSKVKPQPVSEEPFIEYSVGDFEDVIDIEDQSKIYHVKYLHVTL